jgi:hypothetical protein
MGASISGTLVWQEDTGDLVLLITCVPVYSVEEVVFVE